MRTIVGTLALAVAVSTALFANTGCSRIAEEITKRVIKKGKEMAAAAASAEEALGGSDSADDKLSDKLDGYVKVCVNQVSSSVFRSQDRYQSWVDPKKGPTGKERNIYGLFELTQVDACQKDLATSKGIVVADKSIDAPAAAYESALATLAPLVADGYKYYDHGDYKDDKMAKGIKLHKPLMDAFAAFEKADTALRDKVSEVREGLDVRQLATLEKTEGKKLAYHWRALMIEAKKLVRLCHVDDVGKLDEAEYLKAFASFEAAYNALTTYTGAHKDEADKIVLFDWAQRVSEEFYKASKELGRHKRDKVPFKGSDAAQIKWGHAEQVEGHPANVLKKYNELIDRSNGLTWGRG